MHLSSELVKKNVKCSPRPFYTVPVDFFQNLAGFWVPNNSDVGAGYVFQRAPHFRARSLGSDSIADGWSKLDFVIEIFVRPVSSSATSTNSQSVSCTER
jgi:hypothetical protein